MYGQETIDKVRSGNLVGTTGRPAPGHVEGGGEDPRLVIFRSKSMKKDNRVVRLFEECAAIRGGCSGCPGLTLIKEHRRGGTSECICDAYLGDVGIYKKTTEQIKETLRELRSSTAEVHRGQYFVLLDRWVVNDRRRMHVARSPVWTWCGAKIIPPVLVLSSPAKRQLKCRTCMNRERQYISDQLASMVEE